jgi:hypothetical protein
MKVSWRMKRRALAVDPAVVSAGRGNDGESCWSSKSSGAGLHHAAKAKTTLLLQAKSM